MPRVEGTHRAQAQGGSQRPDGLRREQVALPPQAARCHCHIQAIWCWAGGCWRSPQTDVFLPREGRPGGGSLLGTPTDTSPSTLGSEVAGLCCKATLSTLESGVPGSRCPPSPCHFLVTWTWANTLVSQGPGAPPCKMSPVSQGHILLGPFPCWGSRVIPAAPLEPQSPRVQQPALGLAPAALTPTPRRYHAGRGGGGELRPLHGHLDARQPGPQVRQQLLGGRLRGPPLPGGLQRLQVQRAGSAVLQPRRRCGAGHRLSHRGRGSEPGPGPRWPGSHAREWEGGARDGGRRGSHSPPPKGHGLISGRWTVGASRGLRGQEAKGVTGTEPQPCPCLEVWGLRAECPGQGQASPAPGPEAVWLLCLPGTGASLGSRLCARLWAPAGLSPTRQSSQPISHPPVHPLDGGGENGPTFQGGCEDSTGLEPESGRGPVT